MHTTESELQEWFNILAEGDAPQEDDEDSDPCTAAQIEILFNSPTEHRISELTRRDIIDRLVMSEHPFHGRLDLIGFLSRVFDLRSMESTDSRFSNAAGDIWQHVVRNPDWDNDYLLKSYLPLMSCEDEQFLRLVEETVHPAVVVSDEWQEVAVTELNPMLRADGFELVVSRRISGRPVYTSAPCEPVKPAPIPRSQLPDEFPFDIAEFAASLTGVFMSKGRALEVALLAFATHHSVTQTGYDNWDGGTYDWQLVIRVPSHIYGPIPAAEVQVAEESILSVARGIMKGIRGHCVNSVSVTVAVESTGNWREGARHWLNGEGLTNQGRVRSDNIASRECDGLLFRSEPEIRLYRALKKRGVAFAPLPVFVRGGRDYQRLEPDFLLFQDRIVMVVEVDGATVHHESPADADRRLRLFKHEGALIERVSASECATDAAAEACAERLMNVIQKVKQQR